MTSPHAQHQPDPGAADSIDAASDPLHNLFTGKRQTERHPCHVFALLEGARGALPCSVLDLSQTGALVQVDDPDFQAADRDGGMSSYLDLLQVHAQDGLTLTFPEPDLRLSAQVVRFTAGSAGGEPTRVGLRFDRSLTAEELRGLRSGGRQADATSPPAPTHVPRRGARLQAIVFLALKPEVGPLLVGSVSAVGAGHMELRVPTGLSTRELRTRLATGALFLSVIEGPRPLHESTARVLHLEPTTDGCLSVALEPTTPWTPALSKRLQRT